MVNVDQRGSDPSDARPTEGWLDAARACAFLGVKRETLYAYASRGLVGTRGVPGTRKRVYDAADLERLRARHDARAGHGAVAASAMRFGEPVLDSTITGVDAAGPRYRGHHAAALARDGVSFERTAELLLRGALPADARWEAPKKLPSLTTLRALLPHDHALVDVVVASLPALALRDPQRFVTSDEALVERARATIMTLAALVGLSLGSEVVERAHAERTVASRLSVALGGPSRGPGVAALDRALVLSADHELNPSSFACRIAASAGADLHACYLAALGPMLGTGHGGATARVESLVDEVERPERAATALRERLRRGETLPGFGHPLYPQGDPRSEPLLELARPLAERRPRARTLLAIFDAVALIDHAPPNIDGALVALTLALGLPRGAAWVVFLLGRMAGWTAHMLEQRASHAPLRPRARYVGP